MTRGDALPHVPLVFDWMVDRAISRAPCRARVKGFVASLQQLFAASQKSLGSRQKPWRRCVAARPCLRPLQPRL